MKKQTIIKIFSIVFLIVMLLGVIYLPFTLLTTNIKNNYFSVLPEVVESQEENKNII